MFDETVFEYLHSEIVNYTGENKVSFVSFDRKSSKQTKTLY